MSNELTWVATVVDKRFSITGRTLSIEASTLGLPVGYRPTTIPLVSPRTGNTVEFRLYRTLNDGAGGEGGAAGWMYIGKTDTSLALHVWNT